jgi:hypothetical protein
MVSRSVFMHGLIIQGGNEGVAFNPNERGKGWK